MTALPPLPPLLLGPGSGWAAALCPAIRAKTSGGTCPSALSTCCLCSLIIWYCNALKEFLNSLNSNLDPQPPPQPPNPISALSP